MSARVQIVVPTLGRRNAYLAETLESITSQRGIAADVVVVCPEAATETRELADRFGARWRPDPGGGMASAVASVWNGDAEPQYEYVNWIGDDDLLLTGSLSTTVGALDADPEATVAFGYCTYIDEAGRAIWTSRAGAIAPWLMTWGPDLVPQPGALFRKTAVDSVGGLDVGLRYAMDLDLLLRLRAAGRFVNTRRALSAFRWHPESVTVANRHESLSESQAVQRRYMSPWLTSVAPVWQLPVRMATHAAAKNLNRRMQRRSS